ncbi:MAG: hypothetical protein EB059_05350 [Alphaproteobacteria bacterium]|nr:hypothetical protein [Alphaproteobacteria bacterium]
MLKSFVLFLLCACFSTAALAYGYGVPAPLAYPTPNGVSKVGKATGGDCVVDSDCMPGCLPDNDEVVCVLQSEANDSCVGPDHPVTSDRICGCLPDTKHCGFIYAPPRPVVVTPAPAAKVIVKKHITKKYVTKKHKKKKHLKKPPVAQKIETHTKTAPKMDSVHDSGK